MIYAKYLRNTIATELYNDNNNTDNDNSNIDNDNNIMMMMIMVMIVYWFRSRVTKKEWYKYKWRICKEYSTHASHKNNTQYDEGKQYT